MNFTKNWSNHNRHETQSTAISFKNRRNSKHWSKKIKFYNVKRINSRSESRCFIKYHRARTVTLEKPPLTPYKNAWIRWSLKPSKRVKSSASTHSTSNSRFSTSSQSIKSENWGTRSSDWKHPIQVIAEKSNETQNRHWGIQIESATKVALGVGHEGSPGIQSCKNDYDGFYSSIFKSKPRLRVWISIATRKKWRFGFINCFWLNYSYERKNNKWKTWKTAWSPLRIWKHWKRVFAALQRKSVSFDSRKKSFSSQTTTWNERKQIWNKRKCRLSNGWDSWLPWRNGSVRTFSTSIWWKWSERVMNRRLTKACSGWINIERSLKTSCMARFSTKSDLSIHCMPRGSRIRFRIICCCRSWCSATKITISC